MHSDKQRYYTRWFAGMLLAAGAASLWGWSPNLFLNTFMTCINVMIYTGLLLFWIQSLYTRLLPSRARSYMVMTAVLMIFFLLLRVYKYRIVQAALLQRYLVYAYYIPISLIPALFLAVCIRIREGEKNLNRAENSGEYLVLLPALILAALFLTNDWHHLVYIPNIPLSSFSVDTGTYRYGFVFFLMYVWIFLSIGAGIFILIRASGKNTLKRLAAPLVILFAWVVLIALYTILSSRNLPHPYNMPEIHIFCMLGIFESCIRNRLIPYNENYIGFFAGMSFPAMITDIFFRPVYRTKSAVAGTQHQLQESLREPVFTDQDTRLSGMALHGGFVFYTEDESLLRRLHEELREANDTIFMENDVIRREQELKREREGIRERSLLYAKASEEVYPVQRRIDFLLSQAKPGTPQYREIIARILVLMTYVKRKANFCILQAQQEEISLQDLAQAMQETAYYLGYLGMTASVTVSGSGSCLLSEAIKVYDTCEAVLERLYGRATELFVHLSADDMLIMSDIASPISLYGLPLPAEQTYEDGQLTLKVRMGGGGS